MIKQIDSVCSRCLSDRKEASKRTLNAHLVHQKLIYIYKFGDKKSDGGWKELFLEYNKKQKKGSIWKWMYIIKDEARIPRIGIIATAALVN